MRAAVYRNVEAKSTFLGLAFPGEALLVLGAIWVGMLTLPINMATLLGLAIYAGIRLANAGRAPAFAQHFITLKVRALVGGGRLHAAGRVRLPRFPFGPYLSRDLPPRDPNAR